MQRSKREAIKILDHPQIVLVHGEWGRFEYFDESLYYPNKYASDMRVYILDPQVD